MEVRLGRIEARKAEMADRKSVGAEEKTETPTRARRGALRCSIRRSLLMTCILWVLSRAATLEAELPREDNPAARAEVREENAGTRIRQSTMDSSYSGVQDLFRIASGAGAVPVSFRADASQVHTAKLNSSAGTVKWNPTDSTGIQPEGDNESMRGHDSHPTSSPQKRAFHGLYCTSWPSFSTLGS